MIIEYHRPDTLDEALALLARPEPVTVPLAGGSAIHRLSTQPLAVVDLQALGLNTIHSRGNLLELGAMLTLQNLLDSADLDNGERYYLPKAMQEAIEHEASYNLRQVASVAGTLVAADGRSPFATAMLALDALLLLKPNDERIGLGDLLPKRSSCLPGRLITQVSIPLNVRLAYAYVARTPADRPIVCAAVATWPSGRTRVALGGFGGAPILAFDGPEISGAELASESAYSQAGDEWASAEYRQEIAGVLVKRCLNEFETKEQIA